MNHLNFNELKTTPEEMVAFELWLKETAVIINNATQIVDEYTLLKIFLEQYRSKKS